MDEKNWKGVVDYPEGIGSRSISKMHLSNIPNKGYYTMVVFGKRGHKIYRISPL